MKDSLKKIIDAVGVIHVELAKLAVEVDTLNAPVDVADEPAPVEKKPAKKSAKKAAPVKEEKAESTDVSKAGSYTEESLNEINYADLKKIAASLGLSAKGKRNELVERILSAQGDDSADEVEEPAKKPAKKKKSDKVVDLEEKKAEKAAKASDEEDEFGEIADEVLESTEDEDIIDILKEVGLKRITKKNLRAKLIDALSKGLLDEFLDDDEDEEDESVEDAEDEAEEVDDDDDEEEIEIDETTYFEDFDPDGVNDPDECEDPRLATMLEVQETILHKIETGSLKEATMRKFLLSNSTEDEKEEIEEYDSEQVIAAYCELRKRMVDDQGDDMSKEAQDGYYINEELYVCGHKCVEADGELISEVTGDVFDME